MNGDGLEGAAPLPLGANPQRRLRAVGVLLAALVILGALLATGIMPRLRRQAEIQALVESAATSVPAVRVMTPPRAPARAELTLPGNVQAILDTAIHARASGYLARRLVDIGDRVKAGQLLAVIDTPDLDQELQEEIARLAQTRATLAQAHANLAQAHATVEHRTATVDLNRKVLTRWRELGRQDFVSQQQVDERQAAFDASQADLEAARASVAAAEAAIAAAEASVQAGAATVERVRTLLGFREVRAPFDGLVTARYVDPGALITAGTGAGSGPLFRMGQIERLRIYVSVPQTFVPAIRPDLPGDILVREYPGRTFRGRVVSSAEALDPASRTLLTEVQVANEEERLRPGMFAEVRFRLAKRDPPFLIPASALIIRAGPPRVALVGPDDRVRLVPVDLGRDLGATVEVLRGLAESDTLIVTPADDLQEGAAVRPVRRSSP
jgi:multidrug efflux system membrane fusion protein